MDLKFLPYKFESCIRNFKRELLFVEITYYERYMMFEHTNKLIDNVLGFPVARVELAFEDDKLVNVWLYTNETKLEDLLNVFDVYYGSGHIKIDLEGFIEPHNGIQYYWGDDEFVLGLGIKTIENRAYIYITSIEANLYHIEWNK